MRETLLSIENNLCNAVSVIHLARLADYDDCAIDIDNALQMVEEMIDAERQKITNELIMMELKRAEN